MNMVCEDTRAGQKTSEVSSRLRWPPGCEIDENKAKKGGEKYIYQV
jgi:hypothetical protein